MQRATMSEDDLRKYYFAYHEAGHAAAAFFLGIKVKYIKMNPYPPCVQPEKTEGELWENAGDRKDTLFADICAKRKGLFIIAGTAAGARYEGIMRRDASLNERYVAKNTFRGALEDQASIPKSDLVQTCDLFADRERCIMYVVKFAFKLVYEELIWKIIESLAERLCVCDRMEGREAQDIMQAAWGEDSTPVLVMPKWKMFALPPQSAPGQQ